MLFFLAALTLVRLRFSFGFDDGSGPKMLRLKESRQADRTE